MASYCQGCKLNLNETYDEESGSCSNCGIVAETFRFETENKTGLEFNTDGANFLGLYSRPKAGYQKLTVWGWSSSSSGKKRDNILRSKGNEPVPGSQNRKERSSKVPANRELVGGYIESGMRAIFRVISGLARVLHLQKHVGRAYYLVQQTMKKSFKDKRFFKFGEEGGMVGAACLFISAKEENIPVELVHFAMHMNVTVFALGAVYKKVKESLRLPATRVAVSPTILDVVGKILARLKTDQLSKQIENELTKIKEGYVDIICDDKHVEINKRIESLEQLVELSVLIKDLLPKEELQRVIRLSSEIIYIMKNGCLTSYGNKLAIVGASVFISIMHVDRMKKSSTQKYFSNKMESLLVKILSDICHSSVSTIKKYKNEFLAKLMELANNQRAIFGNISTKSDVMSIIERLLKISIAFADKEQLHPEAGVEAGLEFFQDSSCDVSKIENSNEYFVNYKRTHVCCACNEEATAKNGSTRKRKTSETCSDCIPNHSTTDSDDSGDLEHAYCGPLISNIKPKTFIKYQELRKKRTELINSRIMNAISNSELQKKLQKILIKTSKEILEQSLTEKEIINYLLILNTPIDHVLSFPTYTLRDILNCKLREPEVKAMNLNDVEVTERDISDNEVSLYLK